MKRPAKDIGSLLLVLVLVALVYRGFDNGTPERIGAFDGQLTNSTLVLAQALDLPAAPEPKIYSMDGLFLGEELPADFDEESSRVAVKLSYGLSSGNGKPYSLAGGDLEVNGVVLLPANATLEDCHQVFGKPDFICEHRETWRLQTGFDLSFDPAGAFESHPHHHLVLDVRFPHYCEVNWIDPAGPR